MRLAIAGALAAIVLVTGRPAVAQTSMPAVVFVVHGTTFPRFVARPPVSGVVDFGGISMLRGPAPTLDMLDAVRASAVPVVDIARSRRPDVAIAALIERLRGETLVVVVGLAPSGGPASDGPDAVLVATGVPVNLLSVHSDFPLSTLTSDSTHRDGVVIPADVVVTLEDAAHVDIDGLDEGSPIRAVRRDPPVGVYDRYLQYKALSAPIQTGVAIAEVGIGALTIAALRTRRRRALDLALGTALALPAVFLALLLVGHLPTLTYGTVLPTLLAVTVAAAVLSLRVSERSGVGAALALGGAAGLAGLLIESSLGWTAAYAPMLGGSHLDGARFYGMPNVEIGLALGGAVLVASRLRSTPAGAALIAVAGLWFGSPWLGANLGAAVTLLAAAGLWWGLRDDRGWMSTGIAAAAAVLLGTAVVLLAHRLPADVPTHITRFASDGLGLDTIVDKVTDRLSIGARLVADQPAALIPVAGTLVAIAVLLGRMPRGLADGFALEPVARPAALTISFGSVVAYLANDTGAAALGLGFGMTMVTMFAVSLAAAREKMEP